VTHGKNLGADKTRELCRATEQIEGQKTEFIRLGVLGDWDNPYKTMDFKNEAGEIRALAEIVKGGFVFKGLKPVNWCFDCGSAWPKRKSSTRTRVLDHRRGLPDCRRSQAGRRLGLASLAKPAAIVIWTTTPWTIPANQALNVHPEFNYALVDTGDACWCWLKSWSSCLARYNWKARSSPPPVRAGLINFRHPFYDRLSPVYLADYVELGAGTGVVHSRPPTASTTS
jgi:isoleucyl-tRNA synthetase